MTSLPPIDEGTLILIQILCFLSGAVLGAIWGLLCAEKLREQAEGTRPTAAPSHPMQCSVRVCRLTGGDQHDA